MEKYGLYKERVKQLKNVGEINGLDNDYGIYNCYQYFDDIFSQDEFKSIINFKINRSAKRRRCFNNYFNTEIIQKLTNAKMVFGTITLNDDFINSSYETQKKRLQRYLKKHFFYVLKNADYGGKNDRLHYHFIGLTFDNFVNTNVKSKKGRDMYNLVDDDWKYGFPPDFEIIPYDMKDKKRLSNYIVKLNNHSNKITVHHTRLSILKNKNYLKKYCILYDIIL